MIGFDDGDFKRAIAVLIGIGVSAGLLLAWLAPLVWAWIKPWLHALTG